MSVLYGKIRAVASAGTSITVTSAMGVTKTVTVPTGATYIDIPLVGLEEYSIKKTGGTAQTVLLNYGDYVEVNL